MPALFGMPRPPAAIWTPDTPPSNPSAYDDEFGDVLSSKWTTFGTPDVSAANAAGFGSHYHVLKAVGAAFNSYGIYETAPPLPFSVAAKLTMAAMVGNYPGGGILLAANPFGHFGNVGVCGVTYGNMMWSHYSAQGTRSSYSELSGHPAMMAPVYIQLVLHSATNMDGWFSKDDKTWVRPWTAVDPGFTPGLVGLCADAHDNANTRVEATFDWIRFVLTDVGAPFVW